jgi:hypothetical protein
MWITFLKQNNICKNGSNDGESFDVSSKTRNKKDLTQIQFLF